ncbi:MAG: type II toxin-antitoxin system RatA family toxin [Burkholderiaceae bacterium]|nr:MAG: type II toxin-antitoxin system RatA family toxin [Burkholderiaceae bacterium]MCC7288510.1 type II toxin-antitoxin system RatA family toxin [Burkholderiaceae bacterium]
MKRVHKSVLLWYSAREMYDLVTAVEQYPKFLPWCERAEVLQREADAMTARLTLAYAGVRHAFTTRNVHQPARSVLVQLVDGPFSKLDGLWQFEPIGAADAEPACRIEFDLDYAFASKPLETVLSPVFDKVANTLVDRFVQRAEAVYGAR